jgi:very-short-patch-repair endonuclease
MEIVMKEKALDRINNSLIKLGYTNDVNANVEAYYNKKKEDPKITYESIETQTNGAKILKHYGSLKIMFTEIFPQYEWGLIHFKRSNKDKDNTTISRRILEDALKKLGYDTFQEYYETCLNKSSNKIGYDEIMDEQGGSGILANNGRSPLKVFEKYVSEFKWTAYMFKNLQQRYFNDPINKTEWLNDFEKKFNIKKENDWYNITSQDFMSVPNGPTLYGHFNSSTIQIMEFLYPQYDWNPWLIKSGAPNNYWTSIENQKKYLVWLGKLLKIENQDDWYKLTGRKIIDNYGSGMFGRYNNNLYEMINTVFDDKVWEQTRFIKHNTEKIFGDYLNTLSELKYSSYCIDGCINIKPLPFDFGNENSNHIYEVDGDQHFNDVAYFKSFSEDAQKRDIYKIVCAKKKGKKIIRIRQTDIYYNKINWKKIIKDILQATEDIDVYFISLDKKLYNKHIELLLSTDSTIKYKIINETI